MKQNFINHLTLSAIALALTTWACADPAQPTTKYLLLDTRIIDQTDNVRLTIGTVHKHPSNPLFGEDKPWEVRFDNLYANVIFDTDEHIYKCWYNPFIVDPVSSGTSREQRLTSKYVPKRRRETGECYAISKDGIKWEKPEMGLVDFNGSKANNLLLRDTHGPGVFKDAHETDPAKRYKMFQQGMAVRFSPDGVHWSDAIPCKEIAAAGDTHNNAFWAADLNKYVGITRRKIPQRIVVRTESPDFIHWTRAEEVYRGDPDNQAYAMPVFQYGNVYLGLAMMYRIKTDDRVSCELVWSPDTVHWNAVEKGAEFIPLSEKKGDYDWGCIYAAACPVILDKEIRLYYGASNGTHMGWRDGFLALGTLRPDGWAGYVQTDFKTPGAILTKPITCAGTQLAVTADVDQGSIRVFLVSEDGKDLASSKPISGNVTQAPVHWFGTDKNPLATRQGQPVRLRFELDGGKVYSFAFLKD